MSLKLFTCFSYTCFIIIHYAKCKLRNVRKVVVLRIADQISQVQLVPIIAISVWKETRTYI